MNRWMKLGVVLGGYALAFVVSCVAVAIYDRRFTPADNQTMGGMIAGGEMMYGGAVFVLIALVPTGLALWFLRRHRPSWALLTLGCLGFALLGLTAVFITFAPPAPPTRGALALLELFAVVQMLGSPLWIAAFGLFALLAPARDLRIRMLAAIAIEIVIAGCAFVHFVATRI
jgi:hypothetical protein